MSVPGLCLSHISANRHMATFLGSATMILAPFLCALIIAFAMTGWDSLVFDPRMKITSLPSISRIELVMAPEPNIVARLATVAACQSRAQWSILFVPTAALRNFWKR
jgi:hypothetical protein